MKTINPNRFDWKYFKNYVETYDPGKHAINDPKIIFDDMLYGMGVAVNKNYFKFADGYRAFKKWLVKFINQ